MSLEFRANILSRLKQGHEFKNVLPLACLSAPLSLSLSLWQHRLYLENTALHCTASPSPVLNLELPLLRCNSKTTLIAGFFFPPPQKTNISGPFAPNFVTLWYFSIPPSLSPSSHSLKTHCKPSDGKMKPFSFLSLFMYFLLPPLFFPPVYEFLPLSDAFLPFFLFSKAQTFSAVKTEEKYP